ncbi:MAG TPA: hypothetical protein EYN73_08735 [Chromatiaceae bacterium]|jgi:uncharacterized protein|nr:hypothetical protein [Chromatiaceae bacterium]HIN83217.1 hypothetical protein [Chromatiales bacterium]HIA09132.1 hypothetical protein [Chromatiaceae bacterium]HIB83051.1 hypothetical protein [Chromatiaceae bacterium]HIO14429.1 hypothetical protein [Chromatiales bacterium]
MGRTLLIAVAVIGIILIVRHLLSRRKPKPPSGDYKATVRCAHCGTHIPKKDAIAQGERFFCSIEHLSASDSD